MQRRPIGAISPQFHTPSSQTPPLPSSIPLSSLNRLTRKRFSQPCSQETEKTDPAGSLAMQMETRESSSEGSSVLVDQEVIHAALRKCEGTRKPALKIGCWRIPPSSLVTTHSLVHPPASLYPASRSTYSSIKAIIAAHQPHPSRSPEDLMLSPRLTGSKSCIAVVKCGCDPKPELIHSRGRVRSIQMRIANGKQLLPERRKGGMRVRKTDLGEGCHHALVTQLDSGELVEGGIHKGKKLVATKGERVITMSKSGQLLKCFAETPGWFLKH